MDNNQMISSGENTANINETLSHINAVLKKAAAGDFSERLTIPEGETELSELVMNAQLLIDDLIEANSSLSLEKTQDLLEDDSSKEGEESTEVIIDNLTSGVIQYDGSFCIERINPAAEALLAVDEKEVVGLKVLPEHKDHPDKKNIAIISYPVLAEQGKRLSKNMFGESASVHELMIDYPEKKELEVITIPLTNKKTEERRGFIKVIRDITKEREISRSKSDFVNVASHQLRTPLSAVKWVLRMILDGDVGSLDPSQRKLLDKAYETNEKMIVMVNDLLNVSRIEDDRFGYVLKEGDIVAAVSDVVGELRIMAEKGNLDLIFDKPNDIPPFVFDYSKIQLAFHNLIGNAIKYTNEGGTVRVLLSREDDMVVAQVQDTGVGIPEKQIDKMFTKFFRAENVVRLQVGGSGLGLFIVKDIVARHGGTITVKSVENQGTTFTMKIPMNNTATPENKNT